MCELRSRLEEEEKGVDRWWRKKNLEEEEKASMRVVEFWDGLISLRKGQTKWHMTCLVSL
jgi:hypothetical protein